MTTTRLTAHLLVPFIQHTREHNPSRNDIARYLTEKSPPRTERTALVAWQRIQEAGIVETEVCTNCWSIEIIDLVHEQASLLHLNTCTSCYETICNFCHQHVPGPNADECVCSPCKMTIETVPDEYAEAAKHISHYMAGTILAGYTVDDEYRFNTFLSNEALDCKMESETEKTVREWFEQNRKGTIQTRICTLCGQVFIGYYDEDVEHPCPKCPAPEI